MTLEEIFSKNGLLSKKFSGYEFRQQQLDMAKIVDSALALKTVALIEGATGSGKGIGYLAPILLSKKRAIISTSNKSLQDQLSNKDLPVLKKALSFPFTWTVLKGRNNYFCQETFSANQNEVLELLGYPLFKQLLRWLKETIDGDLESVPFELPKKVKELIACDQHKKHEKGSSAWLNCFAEQARRRTSESNVVLVNHSLLALDLSIKVLSDGKGRLLPDAEAIVIDEAHAFEKYASLVFSDSFSINSVRHLLDWKIVKEGGSGIDFFSVLSDCSAVLKGFTPEKDTMYYKQLKTPKFEGLESLTGHIENIKGSVIANVKVLDEQTRIRQEQVINEANHLIERITALSQEDENCVRWSEAYDTQRETVVTLKSVPISVSELIRKPLYENKTVIFTSATLALGKDFSYFKNILGVPKDAFELVTSSPFDYKRNALIYISSGQYDQVWEIEELLKASRGRAFVLFTSYQDMRRFHEQVTVPYPKLIQTQDNSRTTLLEEFKNTPNAVLFATKSFWEGVDVRGEQLSQVIIHKLPFSNPSDIIYASKTEKIDNKFGKGAHWKKYTIPEACLNLKQGIGRLIRSKTDKGVISILDSRINYQNYGKTVLNSLPLAYRTQKLENVKKFFEK